MDVLYSRKAIKFINAADRITQQRIKEGVNGLREDPPRGDVKAMQGQPVGTYRLRVGKYRIIYELRGDTLHIINIGSRGDIYK